MVICAVCSTGGRGFHSHPGHFLYDEHDHYFCLGVIYLLHFTIQKIFVYQLSTTHKATVELEEYYLLFYLLKTTNESCCKQIGTDFNPPGSFPERYVIIDENANLALISKQVPPVGSASR